jgi:hypothetical protein
MAGYHLDSPATHRIIILSAACRRYDFLARKIFLLRRRFFVALLPALIASGCAAYRRYEASRPENIRQTESMLSDAGFHSIQIDTSDQAGLAANLPSYELRSYPASSGSVFWYYDPTNCLCVYEGHQAEYDSYLMMARQQSDTAAYAAESQDQEVASLNALNGAMFPPPVFFFGGFEGIRGVLPSGGGGGHGGSGGGGHGGGGGHFSGGGGHFGGGGFGGGGGGRGGGGGGGHGH